MTHSDKSDYDLNSVFQSLTNKKQNSTNNKNDLNSPTGEKNAVKNYQSYLQQWAQKQIVSDG